MKKLPLWITALGLPVLATLGAAPAAAEMLSVDSPALNANLFLDVARAGERIVAVGDRGLIVYSDDQGQRWQTASLDQKVLLTAVCFADARRGWAVGHDAVVLGTEDGGESWQTQYSDPFDPDAGLEEDFADDELSMDDLSFDDLDSFGAGEEEVAAADTSGAPLLDVLCLGKERAIAVGGYGYALETVNGGNSWQKIGARLTNSEGWHLNAIEVVPGSGTLFIAGEKGLLLRSRDNGLSWSALPSPYAGSFFGVTALSDRTLLAYGLQGNLWISRNDGDNWRKVPTGVSRGINAAVEREDGSVVLTGGAGVVLVSRDRGNSVTLQYLQDRESVSASLPLAGDAMLMVGDVGIRIAREIR